VSGREGAAAEEDGAAAAASRPAPRRLLTGFNRLSRWLSLTLLHHGVWPLLVLLAGAPASAPAVVPAAWFPARLAGPALAAALAALYLRRLPLIGDGAPASRWRAQARFGLLALAAVLAVARLAAGPVEPVAKLLLFGAVDVAAFHLIHFGVVARTFGGPGSEEDRGLAVAVLLFAVSWGMRDAALIAVGGEGRPLLAFAAGFAVGLAVALLVRGLRRWPGGALPAAAAHWTLVSLVFGFAR